MSGKDPNENEGILNQIVKTFVLINKLTGVFKSNKNITLSLYLSYNL